MSKQYVVSACLAGESCRYDGGCSPCPAVQALVRTGQALPVCPEVLGGFRRRASLGIRGGRVVAKDGTDVTGAFTCGAEEALQLALENGCTAAILKARSPSCGSGEIYDGSFTGTACRAKAFSPVWHVRRDSKSGARRRSPKEDSPSCRKSTVPHAA